MVLGLFSFLAMPRGLGVIELQFYKFYVWLIFMNTQIIFYPYILFNLQVLLTNSSLTYMYLQFKSLIKIIRHAPRNFDVKIAIQYEYICQSIKVISPRLPRGCTAGTITIYTRPPIIGFDQLYTI